MVGTRALQYDRDQAQPSHQGIGHLFLRHGHLGGTTHHLVMANQRTYEPFYVDVSHGQVFTGLIPFASCKASTLAMVKAISGERPTRPDAAKLGLTDDLWDLIQSAWVEDVQKRPPVETIVDFLTRAI